MNKQILADYYEHNLLSKKATRLRKRNPKVAYGWYGQYNKTLGTKFTYGYEQGNAAWSSYGDGDGYSRGNGNSYR